jgi:hypothetical protein
MPTDAFISNLFCRVDSTMGTQPQHPQANVHASERVTLALLCALTGGGSRADPRLGPAHLWGQIPAPTRCASTAAHGTAQQQVEHRGTFDTAAENRSRWKGQVCAQQPLTYVSPDMIASPQLERVACKPLVRF